MKRLPVGIQTFREVIEDNHVYVDKTMFIHQLITEGKSYFLSRPRRFGKSLLLDTIAEVFKGNKELFKGLWIYDSGYDFKCHPVVKLDMSSFETITPEVFGNSLKLHLLKEVKDENIDYNDETAPALLSALIRGLCKKHGQKVVVLIDEYDKPILDHITKVELAEKSRAIVRGVYGILKSLDSYIEFIFITGVSKFTKTSVFSSLNNMDDITMQKKYANICGIPVDDLETYFGDRIKEMAESFSRYPNLSEKILEWYDGYSWDGITRLLNPFGLLSFFQARQVKSFWYSSGSPSFLIELLKSKPESIPELGIVTISEDALDAIDVGRLETSSLLFQTGYLTVEKVLYDYDWPEYVLKIPNLEVKEAFFRHITAGLAEKEYIFTENKYRQMRTALSEGDLKRVQAILQSLFSSIPYQLHVAAEAYYHSIFFVIMNVLGFKIDAEVSTARGRIDAVLELPDKVYVFEFKYENCPQDADEETRSKTAKKALERGMEQITERGYGEKFRESGKAIHFAVFVFLGREHIEMEASTDLSEK